MPRRALLSAAAGVSGQLRCRGRFGYGTGQRSRTGQDRRGESRRTTFPGPMASGDACCYGVRRQRGPRSCHGGDRAQRAPAQRPADSSPQRRTAAPARHHQRGSFGHPVVRSSLPYAPRWACRIGGQGSPTGQPHSGLLSASQRRWQASRHRGPRRARHSGPTRLACGPCASWGAGSVSWSARLCWPTRAVSGGGAGGARWP